jgi:multidrug resistance efflux pump
MAVRLHKFPPSGPQLKLVPQGIALAQPTRPKPQLTVGRVIYFASLSLVGAVALYWLVMTLVFATAVGVVDQDLDRLAPPERGRITRISVKPGQKVKAGEPLVWLDYGSAQVEGQAFVSAAAARTSTREVQLSQMRDRRKEIDRLVASTRAIIGGLYTQASGLKEQRAALVRSRDTAVRLQHQGAATQAELLQFDLRMTQLDQDRAVALREGAEQQRALEALVAEAKLLDQALAQREATVGTDPGTIVASRDGTVAEVAFHVGEVVGPENAVVMLLDDESIRVRAYVAPKDAPSFAPGAAARIGLPTWESMPGQVEGLHLLATISAPAAQVPQLSKNPGAVELPSVAAPPVDPTAAFMLADVSVGQVPDHLAARLIVGSPCEVRVRRSYEWLWNRFRP